MFFRRWFPLISGSAMDHLFTYVTAGGGWCCSCRTTAHVWSALYLVHKSIVSLELPATWDSYHIPSPCSLWQSQWQMPSFSTLSVTCFLRWPICLEAEGSWTTGLSLRRPRGARNCSPVTVAGIPTKEPANSASPMVFSAKIVSTSWSLLVTKFRPKFLNEVHRWVVQRRP